MSSHHHGLSHEHSQKNGHDHSHDHDHDHDHSHAPSSLPALSAVIALTTVIFLAELIAGLLSRSLALLSDAMHMLSDSTGLIIALIAVLLGRREANAQATFGHRRFEVLAALLNALTVTVVCLWIVFQAFRRLGHDNEIDTGMMLIVAVIGLVANAVSALILVRRSSDSLNMRGAYLHVLTDMLGSVAVIIAGFIIRWTGFVAADTIASLIIAALVVPRSISLVRQSLAVLLERAPHFVDAQELQRAVEEVEGVKAVHDFHVWSTDGTDLLVTCHVVVANAPAGCSVLDAVQEQLEARGVGHSTIQIEEPKHSQHEEICH